MTTKPNLDELEALCDAATPGPWKIEEACERYYFRCPDKYSMGHKEKENFEFIAAAREALPALITENKELKARVERGSTLLRSCGGWLNRMLDGVNNEARVREVIKDVYAELACLGKVGCDGSRKE